MQSHGLNLYLHLERIKKFRNVTNMTETLANTFPVAAVIEAGLTDSITGKFETVAQILAIRLAKARLLEPLLHLKSHS